MKLRPRIAVASCLVALAAIGSTGVLLIRQSRAYSNEQLLQRQELLVRNRALGLSASLDLAVREMVRLSHMAELDLTDNDLRPEAALLAHAHRNSTLFNIGLQIEDAHGRCIWSEPASTACTGHSYADEPWFIAGRTAQGPLVMNERLAASPSEINVVVPIGGRPGAADGVLRGIIDLRSDKVVSPSLADNLASGTEVALVSASGRLIYPASLEDSPGWTQAIALSTHEPGGAFVLPEPGRTMLYAHAPVGGVDWGLIYRWRYSDLDTGFPRQLRLLLVILASGVALAMVLGLLSTRLLIRPLEVLAEAVRALGDARSGPTPRVMPEAAGLQKIAARSDEIGELARAFSELRARLAVSDEQHQQDLNQIRELASSLEARVRARTAELEAAQRSLVAQERLAAMGHAAAVISHELKNSLNALGMGFDLLAMSGADGARLQKVNAQVRNEVNRLREMTDELLVFARAPRISAAPTDINELLRGTYRLCEEQASSSGVRIVLRPALSGAPLMVTCDASRMKSVLVNLLQNAIEALAWTDAPRRDVVVSSDRPRGERLVAITIEDSGPGVPAEAREHLFEPFFTTKRNGTGLGLATAQRFIAAHGGQIELRSSQLGGACFVVTLPLQAHANREAA